MTVTSHHLMVWAVLER